MAGEWTTSKKFKGLSWKEHTSRKVGKHPDRYYKIRYQLVGKTKTEYLGWTSEGMNEEKAGRILSELKESQIQGEGYLTLKEKKQAIEQERIDQERIKEEEKLKKMTYEEIYLNHYKNHYKKIKNEIRSCDSLYNIWVKPILGNLSLNEINEKHFNKIKNNLIKQEKTPRTIQSIFATIRHCFNYSIKFGFYEGENPLGKNSRIELPKVNNMKTRFLSRNEAEILLNELKKHSIPTYQKALLSLNSGLRAKEISDLKWQDLDIEHGIINARLTKNSEPRHIPMSNKLIEMFKEMEQGRPFEKVFKENGISKTFMRVVDKLKMNEGITDSREMFTFHNLRHTFASWTIQAGVPIEVLSKLLGHKSLQMTMRYAHLAPENFEAIKRVFD